MFPAGVQAAPWTHSLYRDTRTPQPAFLATRPACRPAASHQTRANEDGSQPDKNLTKTQSTPHRLARGGPAPFCRPHPVSPSLTMGPASRCARPAARGGRGHMHHAVPVGAAGHLCPGQRHAALNPCWVVRKPPKKPPIHHTPHAAPWRHPLHPCTVPRCRTSPRCCTLQCLALNRASWRVSRGPAGTWRLARRVEVATGASPHAPA